MEKKWHVSPKTGKLERCRAFILPCRYEESSPHENSEVKTLQEYAVLTSAPVFNILQNSRKVELSDFDINEYQKLFKTDSERFDSEEITYANGMKDAWMLDFNSMPLSEKVPFNIYENEENSARINAFLMGDVTALDHYGENKDTIINTIIYLENYIKAYESISSEFKTLYKGFKVSNDMSANILDNALDKLELGTVFEFKSFASASWSYWRARDFADNDKTFIYEINTKSGAYLNGMVEEQLLPRKSKFLYMGKDEAPLHTIIKLAEER